MKTRAGRFGRGIAIGLGVGVLLAVSRVSWWAVTIAALVVIVVAKVYYARDPPG